MSTSHHRPEHRAAEHGSTGQVGAPPETTLSDPPVPPALGWPLRVGGFVLLIVVTLGLASVADNIYGAHGQWIDLTGIGAMAAVSLVIFVLRERHSRAWVPAEHDRADERGVRADGATGGAEGPWRQQQSARLAPGPTRPKS